MEHHLFMEEDGNHSMEKEICSHLTGNFIVMQQFQRKIDVLWIGNYAMKLPCGGKLLLLQDTLCNFSEKGFDLLFYLGIY